MKIMKFSEIVLHQTLPVVASVAAVLKYILWWIPHTLFAAKEISNEKHRKLFSLGEKMTTADYVNF